MSKSHRSYHMKASQHAKLAEIKKAALKNKQYTLTEQEYHEIAHAFKIADSQNSVAKLFSDDKIKSYLKYIIKKYAALDEDGNFESSVLNGTELKEAVRLNLIKSDTSHEPHHETSSWFTTMANVISAIPKGLVLALVASEVFKAVGACNKYNPTPDNSDTILHGSASNAERAYGVKYFTLPNKNCIAFGIAPVNNHDDREIYGKCFNGPCLGQTSISTKGAKYLGWGHGAASDMEIKSVGDNQAVLKFQHLTLDAKKDYTVKHICNLPLSPGYKYLEESIRLWSSGNYTRAMVEVNEALRIDPNFESAIIQKKAISQLLLSTTIEPSYSTSLIEEASTTTETSSFATNSTTDMAPSSTLIEEDSTTTKHSTPTKTSTTIMKENTAHAEPSNAPFNDVPIPTSTSQNTTNQGWSLKDISVVVVVTGVVSAVCGTIVIYFHKRGYDICQKYCSKSKEESYSVSKAFSDSHYCELSVLTEDAGLMMGHHIVNTVGSFTNVVADVTEETIQMMGVGSETIVNA